MLFSSACQPSTALVSSLQAVEAAAEAAVPVLSATGYIPAPLVPVVETYLNAVSVATAKTVAELDSTDTSAQKAAAIEGYWVGVVVPGLPSSVSASAVAEIQAVNAAVQAFLAHLHGGVAQAIVAANQSVSLTHADRAVLHDIESRAEKLHARLSK
jgi:hypothetical protein